jgi:phosphoglycolate phosphatase-like HAD superfamily hydrolase
LFVGDGDHDLVCSSSAGTIGVLVRNVSHDNNFVETDLEKKHLHKYAFDDLSDLLTFLMENEDAIFY